MNKEIMGTEEYIKKDKMLERDIKDKTIEIMFYACKKHRGISKYNDDGDDPSPHLCEVKNCFEPAHYACSVKVKLKDVKEVIW